VSTLSPYTCALPAEVDIWSCQQNNNDEDGPPEEEGAPADYDQNHEDRDSSQDDERRGGGRNHRASVDLHDHISSRSEMNGHGVV